MDWILEQCGVTRPDWNDANLNDRITAFDLIVQHHYRFYQFYAGVLMVLPLTYGVHRIQGGNPLLSIASDIGLLAIEGVLFAGSRDALRKYYRRGYQLLGPRPDTETDDMFTNGSHHKEKGGKRNEKTPQPLQNPANPPEPGPKTEDRKNDATAK